MELHLRDDRVVGLYHTPPDLLGAEGIDRVAGDDGMPRLGGLGVEAGRAVAATEDAAREVIARQGEHAAVFLERTPPRHDLSQLHPVPPGPAGSTRSRSCAPPSLREACAAIVDSVVTNANLSLMRIV